MEKCRRTVRDSESAEGRVRDSESALEEYKVVARAYKDETWIDGDFGEGILSLAGGARKRKARKNYKGQKVVY